MFGTTRVPGEAVDTLVHHPDSQHIVVLRHHRFYRMPILDSDGLPYVQVHTH